MTYQLLVELSATGATVQTAGAAGTSHLDLGQLGHSPRTVEAITAVGLANPESSGHALSELTSVLRSVLAAAQPLMGGSPQAVEVHYPTEWASLSIGLLSDAVSHSGMPSTTKITPASHTGRPSILDTPTAAAIDPMATVAAPAVNPAGFAAASLFQPQTAADPTVALSGFDSPNSGEVVAGYGQLPAERQRGRKLLAGVLAIVTLGGVALGGALFFREEGELLPFGVASNGDVKEIIAGSDSPEDSDPSEEDAELAPDTETTTSATQTTGTGSTPSTAGTTTPVTGTTTSTPTTPTTPTTTSTPTTPTTPTTGTTSTTSPPVGPTVIVGPTITLGPSLTLHTVPQYTITLGPVVTFSPVVTLEPVITLKQPFGRFP